MLLLESAVVIEEWREETRLIAIAQKYPGRLRKDESGWRSPEIESHLKALGIDYRLRSAEEHPRSFVQNLNFLAEYYAPGTAPLEERALRAIKSCFTDRAFMTIGDLIACGTKAASPAE
jgi:putative transposase